MELSLLQIGLILLLAAIGGIFAYFESSPRENKFITVPSLTLLGGVGGFFLFYIGIFILWVIVFIALIIALKYIFGPKVIIVKEDTNVSIGKKD